MIKVEAVVVAEIDGDVAMISKSEGLPKARVRRISLARINTDLAIFLSAEGVNAELLVRQTLNLQLFN